MVREIKPDQTINECIKVAPDPELASYLRTLAELIFDAWREQHSDSVNPTKASDSSEKNNVPI